MSRADELRQEIKHTEHVLKNLKAELEDAKGDEYFCCEQCGKRTQVSKTTLIRKHQYVQPYGCTGGDYWTHLYYMIMCSKCSETTIVRDEDTLYPFIADHLGVFAEILDWHPMRHHPHPTTLEWLREQQQAA